MEQATTDEWRNHTFIFQTATQTNDASLKFDKTAGKLTGGKCQENGTGGGGEGGQGAEEEESEEEKVVRRRTRNRRWGGQRQGG